MIGAKKMLDIDIFWIIWAQIIWAGDNIANLLLYNYPAFNVSGPDIYIRGVPDNKIAGYRIPDNPAKKLPDIWPDTG